MSGSPTKSWSEAQVRRRFITPELVSGIVFVSVVIAVADEVGGIFDVFFITILSVVVFWASDVFAHTIADQRRREDDDPVKLDVSFTVALREARGYLLAAIAPLAFLLFGLFGPNGGWAAYWIALWVQVALLGVVGWFAFGGRRIAWYGRIAGSLATAALGVLAIFLKIIVH